MFFSYLLWLRMEATSSEATASDIAEILRNNALRRERKQKRKEERRANNAAENQPDQSNRIASVDEEDMDPTQYLENRLKYLAAQKTQGINPYPHKLCVSMSIDQYINKYGGLSNGEHLEDVSVSLAGRIMQKRSSGAKLVFYDLHGGGFKVQVMADASKSELDEVEFSKFHSNVKRGDIVGVIGFPGKSKKGELSIFPKTFVVLSHCLHMMPRQKSAAVADNANLKGNPWVPGSARNPETYILKDQMVS